MEGTKRMLSLLYLVQEIPRMETPSLMGWSCWITLNNILVVPTLILLAGWHVKNPIDDALSFTMLGPYKFM
jgi:hypothetical protein